jgi:uncharacterized membrane protein
MQFTFKIGSKIKEVWPIYKKHFSMFLLLTVATMVVQFIGSNNNNNDKNWILIVISYILSILLSYIWINFVLSLIDKKDLNPFSRQSFPTLKQYWNLFTTMLLVALCVLVGFILLVVPGFYVAGRLVFATYMSVDKNQGGIKNVKEAWNMTKGYGWKLFWKSFVIGLFIMLGFVALFIGAFITYPIGMIVLLMMYREFSKMKLETPPTSVSAEVIN